jgi:hypothetical protein
LEQGDRENLQNRELGKGAQELMGRRVGGRGRRRESETSNFAFKSITRTLELTVLFYYVDLLILHILWEGKEGRASMRGWPAEREGKAERKQEGEEKQGVKEE